MESQIDLVFEKETKNYWKYREFGSGINVLYLKKTEGQPAPKSIAITIKVGQK